MKNVREATFAIRIDGASGRDGGDEIVMRETYVRENGTYC